MKPKIIMHTQISLDGRIKGFDNPEVYYQVAGGIHSDAVLFGSNTVFTAFEKYPAETEADFEKIITSPEDPRPIGVIPDSRGILIMKPRGQVRWLTMCPPGQSADLSHQGH